MVALAFHKKILWAEMLALVLIAVGTILPIKFGYVFAGGAELNVKSYYAAAILVILCTNVAYLIKCPAGVRLKVALINLAVTAFVCLPWINQAELSSLDYSHLGEGGGVPSLIIFSVVLAFFNYLAASMTSLIADRKG